MTITEQTYDVVVIGAGAGGMAAAITAATEGLSVVVVEKMAYAGGAAAISGGMVWAPNSHLSNAEPGTDNLEQATRYLDALAGQNQLKPLRQAYLEKAPQAIAYLDKKTHVKLTPVPFYPDYHPELPGATTKGRVLEPVPFDGRELGRDFARLGPPLPEFTLLGGMMVARPDLVHFRNLFKSPKSMLRVLRLIAAYGIQRLRYPRGTSLVLGNALVGRMLKSLQDLNVPILYEATTQSLIESASRIAGAVVETPSGTCRLLARKGVVLATGGYSHNQDMRHKYLPANAGPFSASAKSNTGDGLQLALDNGAVVPGDDGNNAYWAPVSCFVRANGAPAVFPHTVTDRGKPGMLAVNSQGLRFTNESNSYHDFVLAMLETDALHACIPSYLVCDKASLWQYGLGAIKPMNLSLKPFVKSGYLIKAETLPDLADQLAVPRDSFLQTIATYNADALKGVDSQFGRGGNAYHRYVGDAANAPNPCMRPVETGPFYAVKLYPADLGTAAGLKTDGQGQVLAADETPIKGLYAAGNDMNSIMAGSYPGPGITLGPALVFGYLAAMHMAHGVDK